MTIRADPRARDRLVDSLADGTAADDPRCRSIAAFVIAVCDGLAMQWLLDPEMMPSGDELRDGLATVWAASGIAYQPVPDLPPEIPRTAGRTSAK
ncbi:MAG: TetR family transcriptional regulator C-terminal domain-containing protein [Actinomycetota bacterium]|nr:TetR family transcriptional regulator C-terminal domain-containing protein [Actinomycetota bacterium]